MLVAKYTTKGKDRIGQVLKIGKVLFDARDQWVLVKDLDRDGMSTEVHWIHPDEVFFHWMRTFG